MGTNHDNKVDEEIESTVYLQVQLSQRELDYLHNGLGHYKKYLRDSMISTLNTVEKADKKGPVSIGQEIQTINLVRHDIETYEEVVRLYAKIGEIGEE